MPVPIKIGENTAENIEKVKVLVKHINQKANLPDEKVKEQTVPGKQSLPRPAPPSLPQDIVIEVIGSSIIVKMPKRNADVQFITGIKYVKWIRDQFVWKIPHYGDNLDRLKRYFAGRIER